MLSRNSRIKKEIDLARSISVRENEMSGRLSFGCFVLGAQASGAKVEVLHLAVNWDGGGVNVGRPVPVGMAFGMADIMTVLRYFAA
jgi:hypothetical protein